MESIINAIIVQAVTGIVAAFLGMYFGFKLLEWRVGRMERDQENKDMQHLQAHIRDEADCKRLHERLDAELDKEHDNIRAEMKFADGKLEVRMSEMCDLYHDTKLGISELSNELKQVRREITEMDTKRAHARKEQSDKLQEIFVFMGYVKEFMEKNKK